MAGHDKKGGVFLHDYARDAGGDELDNLDEQFGFTPAGFGIYCSTKHALEAIAESMKEALKPHNIKVQTINPGPYLTGFNETMAESAFLWLDDSKNFTKRAALKKAFDDMLGQDSGRLDANEMIAAMVAIVPSDTGKFRNVVPKSIEDFLKVHQQEA